MKEPDDLEPLEGLDHDVFIRLELHDEDDFVLLRNTEFFERLQFDSILYFKLARSQNEQLRVWVIETVQVIMRMCLTLVVKSE